MTFAAIGGIAVALYLLHSFCMSGYNEFKFEQALLKDLYPQEQYEQSFWSYTSSKWCGGKPNEKYAEAQRSLDEEMDLVHMVKQLRLLRSMSDQKHS
jgi:hypothetical protein